MLVILCLNSEFKSSNLYHKPCGRTGFTLTLYFHKWQYMSKNNYATIRLTGWLARLIEYSLTNVCPIKPRCYIANHFRIAVNLLEVSQLTEKDRLEINTPLWDCFRWRECLADQQKIQNRISEMPNVSFQDTPLTLSRRELTVAGYLPTVHTASGCLLFRELESMFRSRLSVPEVQWNKLNIQSHSAQNIRSYDTLNAATLTTLMSGMSQLESVIIVQQESARPIQLSTKRAMLR